MPPYGGVLVSVSMLPISLRPLGSLRFGAECASSCALRGVGRALARALTDQSRQHHSASAQVGLADVRRPGSLQARGIVQ